MDRLATGPEAPSTGLLAPLASLRLRHRPADPRRTGARPASREGGAHSREGDADAGSRRGFEQAVAKGTRTRIGAPGPRYWQQWSEYRLEAELNPISKRLAGHGTIKYYNRSPDTLAVVYVQLLHNIFAPGAHHNTNVPWSVEGMICQGAAQGSTLTAGER